MDIVNQRGQVVIRKYFLLNNMDKENNISSLKDPITLLKEAFIHFWRKFLVVNVFTVLFILSYIFLWGNFPILAKFFNILYPLPFLAIFIIFSAFLISYQDKGKIWASFKEAWKSLLNYCFVIVLVSCILLGVLGIWFSIVMIFVLMGVPQYLIPLLGVPVLISFAWALFSLFACIIDKEKGVNALVKSYSYISRRMVQVMLLTCFPLMLSVMMVYFFAVQGLELFAFLLFLFFWPLMLVYEYRLYLSLQESHDGKNHTRMKIVFYLLFLLGTSLFLCLGFLFVMYFCIYPLCVQ